MKRFPFQQIDRILNEINHRYSSINHGGCGAMAGMIGHHISRLVDVNIVVRGGWVSVTDARATVSDHNSIDDWERNGVGFHHVWVEFKWRGRWYAADCHGLRPRVEMRNKWGDPLEGSFTINEMKILGDDPSWNPSFDRNQIPSMKNVVGRRFNTLINEMSIH